MEIRVPHDLTPDQVTERVRAAATRHGLVVPADASASGGDGRERAGVLVKETPLGAVRARWVAVAGELVVTVEERPAFLPEGMVRRALEDGLRELLAG